VTRTSPIVAIWLAPVFALSLGQPCLAQTAPEPGPRPSVVLGATGTLQDVVLPGPELVVRPLDRDAPLVLRIVSVFPHGSAHRYELEFYGLEAGRYDLGQLLAREDGSPAEGLPALPVDITDPLPAGQAEPQALAAGRSPNLGGYRTALVVGGVLWAVVLGALVVGGRRRRGASEAPEEQQGRSPAEELRALAEAARGGDLDSEGQARLERLLLSTWRRRLGLTDVPHTEALARLREHPEAGALLGELEAWLHQPPGRGDPVDLEALLRRAELPAEARA
jgi:hypothetical protein